MTFTQRDARDLCYRADAAEAECEEWQHVAMKLYRALVIGKNRRGVEYRDAPLIAEALLSYEKIA